MVSIEHMMQITCFALYVVFQLTHTHITHIQEVHDIVGPLVPYKQACPKRDWSTETESCKSWSKCSTSKPPRLDCLESVCLRYCHITVVFAQCITNLSSEVTDKNSFYDLFDSVKNMARVQGSIVLTRQLFWWLVFCKLDHITLLLFIA